MANQPAKTRRPAPRKPAAQEAPHVIVDFIFDEGALFVAIENISDAPVLKVKTRFSENIHGVEGRVHINALAMFENIEFLAPRKAITTFLDTSAAYFGRNEPRKITVQISYRDTANKAHRATIHHDLGIYADIGYIRRARDKTNNT